MAEVVVCREGAFLLLQFLLKAAATASVSVAERMASNVIDAPLDDVIKQKRFFGNRRGFRGGARGRGGRGGGGGVKKLSTGKKFGVKNFGNSNGTVSDLRDKLAKKEVGDLRQKITTPKAQPLQVKTVQSVPANNKRQQTLRAAGRSRAMTTGGISNRQAPQNVPFQLSHEEMKKIQITVPGRNRPVEVRAVAGCLELLESKLPCQRLSLIV